MLVEGSYAKRFLILYGGYLALKVKKKNQSKSKSSAKKKPAVKKAVKHAKKTVNKPKKKIKTKLVHKKVSVKKVSKSVKKQSIKKQPVKTLKYKKIVKTKTVKTTKPVKTLKPIKPVKPIKPIKPVKVAKPAKKSEPIVKQAKKCKKSLCKELAFANGYCRYHYIASWKAEHIDKKVRKVKHLEKMITEIKKRFPSQYLELIKGDLMSDKIFRQVLKDMDLEEDISDFEISDDTQKIIDSYSVLVDTDNEEEF